MFCVICFDTSSLPETPITINDAWLDIYLNTKNTADSDFFRVVPTPVTGGDLVDTDFNDFGSTALADDIDVTDFTNNAHNEVHLNLTGLATIQTDDYTCFGFRQGLDLTNTTPTGNNGIGFYSRERVTEDQRPTFHIDYTEDGGSSSSSSSHSGSLIIGEDVLIGHEICVDFTESGSGELVCSEWQNYLYSDTINGIMDMILWLFYMICISIFSGTAICFIAVLAWKKGRKYLYPQ